MARRIKLKELDERLDNEEAVDSPSSPETLSVWGLAWPSILNLSLIHI